MTTVPHLLPRFSATRRELDRKVARIILETGAGLPPVEMKDRRVFKAEAAELRGIPVQARGVGGVSPGSDPLRHVIAEENRRERMAS